MIKQVSALVAGVMLSMGVQASAQEEAMRAKLQALDPNMQISAIAESPIAGLYMVQVGAAELFYISADANYVMQGDMIDIGSPTVTNLTTARRGELASVMLKDFPREKMVIFSPEQTPKASITVFTDVDCGYCRKLHSEVPALNSAGIEVRYMAFPRGAKSVPTMESIWCADDPQAAMTAAKSGQEIEAKSCDNPVREEYALGQEMGVRGTPAVFLSTGQMIPGYRPAHEIAEMLGL